MSSWRAKRTELRPKLALTPELRTQMAALIMKLDRHDIYFFGKPTFDSARISDVMFDRPLIGALQGTTEQNPSFLCRTPCEWQVSERL